MTEATIDLTKYKEGNKVIVQVNLPEANDKGETLIEVEGKVVAANELGILLKPKGRTQVELIEASTIEDVDYAPESPKALKQKVLTEIEYGKARQHLVDRHGVALSEVNEMTEEKALDYHNRLSHEDLGHEHGDKAEAGNEAEGEKEDGE